MKFWRWNGRKVIGWVFIIGGARMIMVDLTQGTVAYSNDYSWAFWIGGIVLIVIGIKLFKNKKVASDKQVE